jgi:hypothetical protein
LSSRFHGKISDLLMHLLRKNYFEERAKFYFKLDAK